MAGCHTPLRPHTAKWPGHPGEHVDGSWRPFLTKSLSEGSGVETRKEACNVRRWELCGVNGEGKDRWMVMLGRTAWWAGPSV